MDRMWQQFQSWNYISYQIGWTHLRRTGVSCYFSLPRLFPPTKAWGQPGKNEALTSSLSLCLSLLSPHRPPTPTPCPQPRVEGLCTTPPLAASSLQVTLEMPVGASSVCGRLRPQRARSCICTLKGCHCTRRTGKPLRVPSQPHSLPE